MKELNRRFKEYRISLNITQEEMSQKSGVSVFTIKNFERGSDIKVSTLERLLQVFGMNNLIDNLIPDETDRPSYRALQAKNKTKKRAHKHIKQTNWKWNN